MERNTPCIKTLDPDWMIPNSNKWLRIWNTGQYCWWWKGIHPARPSTKSLPPPPIEVGWGANLQTGAAKNFLFVPVPAKAKKLGLLSIYKFSLTRTVRGAMVQKRDRKYHHDWLYLQSINTRVKTTFRVWCLYSYLVHVWQVWRACGVRASCPWSAGSGPPTPWTRASSSPSRWENIKWE